MILPEEVPPNQERLTLCSAAGMPAGRNGQLVRTPTFVPGLDEITSGGLFRGGNYLVTGPPGTGKTVLAAQMCFGAARAGEHVVYVTLLTETHERMLANLRTLDFFSLGSVADRIAFISGYVSLSTEGLDSLLALIREEVQRRAATFLVIDGISVAEGYADSEVAFKRFVHDMQVMAVAFDCTTVLLSDSPGTVQRTEAGVVEGIFELCDAPVGLRAVRQIRVTKLRGSSYLGGFHVFTITRSGVTVFPRFEASTANLTLGAWASPDRIPTGVQELDAMLRGGLPAGSTTLLLGAPGSGKTVLALHAGAASARSGRTALHYSFHEAPETLVAKGRGVGLALEEYVGGHRLQLRSRLPLEALIDVFAAEVMADVREHAPACVVIDGLDGLRHAAAFPDRAGSILAAMGAALRQERVTTVFTAEISNLFGFEVDLPLPDVSALVDNIVLLRYLEQRARLYRLLSILKVRDSEYDADVREFSISASGVTVAPSFRSAEAILSGTADERAAFSEPAPSPPAERDRRGRP